MKESQEYVHFRRFGGEYGTNCGLLWESVHLPNGHGETLTLEKLRCLTLGAFHTPALPVSIPINMYHFIVAPLD